ncbi:3-carboxy-cis,cis-muconate cycloisomerase [Pseudovibrio exalbescens]|uniref:Fumarate lyase N-terminal domain-containing protein n=1 Tax=Pseudovibrio exalbescens TaxID=197461 RepID=A0A1U7JLU1_9HYPH|nr:3-carboxy-cis,cis-muconate cycloisomerase [Pseudovibrio exalbescens]OKL45687.1 hypothetical protein A3843_01770 [Pseudovibrio exalbescens]
MDSQRFFAADLFFDEAVDSLFSEQKMVAHAVQVEWAAASTMAQAGLVPSEHSAEIDKVCATFTLPHEDFVTGSLRDGVFVPQLVKQLRADLSASAAKSLHFGLTSQDVIDTALMMSLQAAVEILSSRLSCVREEIARLDREFGSEPLSSWTRMQKAISGTVSDRLSSWSHSLDDLAVHLARVEAEDLKVQVGGPVGTRAAFGEKTQKVVAGIADRLNLSEGQACWHADRKGPVRLASTFSGVSGSLGKIGQDLALMSQQGIETVRLSGGGGSSAMPHKQNPVLAEVLVTLARFNASQIGAMHHSLVHENERSGAAWMLEWMILPKMASVAARSLSCALELLKSVEALGES